MKKSCPNCCPDEEGIKTRARRHVRSPLVSARPNCCPDEEGIKTRPRLAGPLGGDPMSELLP